MATALTAQAGSPSLEAAPGTGTGTYIVAFNDAGGSFHACDDQIGTFAAEHDAQVTDRYSLINAYAVSVPTQQAAEQLRQLPGVRYVEKDITFHASLECSAPQIGAPVAWETGLTGKGVTVCVVDTGIDGTHPDLKGRIVGWKDIVGNSTTPYDDFGHGTHCAGIIAGNGAASGGKYRGIAPEAKLIGVKVLGKNGAGNESDILAGIQYAAGTDANVISLSLGSDEHSQAICDAVSEAVHKGKIVVCAVGNSGPKSGTVGCPADNKDAIAVGAVDGKDYVCSFSSRGPTKDGEVKPDVVAPGWKVVSCRACGIMDSKAIDNYYLAESGSSMACPMVSGTVALMVQKDPKLTPERAKEILHETACHLGATCPNNDCGYGRVNISGALACLDGTWKAPAPKPAPAPSPADPVLPAPSPAPGLVPSPGYPGQPYPYQPISPYPGYLVPQYPGASMF
ncbi:MAG TPA: S8 family serine peptidase [Methanocella sp.]|nr:S8 family serine peptidase [Methanocella sp.]